jgi:uncharacterized membrane protein YdjX (TVP38/TMEM64 family)
MPRVVVRLGALCVFAAVLVAVWRYSPLREWSDPARLGELLDDLSRSPWAGPLVVFGFLVGSFLVLPVTGMIAATGIALGPTDGLLWASVGSFVGATVTYGLARVMPEKTIENWVGPWIGKMGQRFERGGIVAIMVARNVPIAPFTLINVVAGGARVPYLDFLIGTVLGMAPVIAALTILGDRLRGAWEAPTALNISLLALAVVSWFVLACGLQALSNRWLSHAKRSRKHQ